MTTWRKYGGSVDVLTNLSVGSIVADSLSLNNFYLGNWDICGGLRVKDNAYIARSADICGNLVVGNNLTIIGQLALTNDANFTGNLVVYNDVYMTNKLYFDPNGSTLLHANAGGFGFNKANPIATIDIGSDRVQTIYLKSSASSNRNVLAQNADGRGLVVNVDNSTTEIKMFADTSMNADGTGVPNAMLKYNTGGDFIFDVSNVLHMRPRVVFSSDITDTMNSAQEQITIYDSSESRGVSYPYMYDIYGDTNFKTGLAFTAVSRDTSSNIFFKLTSTAGRGFVVGGGAGKGGTMMGTLALTDTTNSDFSRYMYPAINFFSGDVLRQLKTTVAFNKFNPSKKPDGISNYYALDVNGPTKILHQELLRVADVSMEIFALNIVGNIGYAVCGPATIASPYQHYILKTVDGGFSWFQLDIGSSDLNAGTSKILSLYFNANNLVIAGEGGFLFYSSNAGTTFTRTTYNGTAAFSINDIYYVVGTRYLFAILDSSAPFGKFFDITGYPGATINVSDRKDTSLNDLRAMDGSGNLVFFAGVGGLQFYNVATNILSGAYETGHTFNDVGVYYDGGSYHAVAVGVGGVIRYFHGSSPGAWSTPVVLPAGVGNYNAVLVLNSAYAIAVGDAGLVAYSNNGFSSWKLVTHTELDAMGNGALFTSYNLTNITGGVDDNFFITAAYQTFNASLSRLGRTKIFDLHAPYFFSRSTKSVLDVSGTMRVSGDIFINDNGNLVSSDATVGLFSAGATTTINIGATGVGNTIVQNTLISGTGFIAVGDASFNGRILAGGNTIVSGNLFLANALDSCANILQIGGNNTQKMLVGALDTCSEIWIGATNATGSRGAPVDVYIGDSIQGNVRILGNLYVPGTIVVENQTNLEIANKTILLNDGGSLGSSFGAGLLINDAVHDSGRFIVNTSRHGYHIKAPASTNIVNIDVNGLALPDGLSKGIVTIVPTITGDGSAFTMSRTVVDISDIAFLDVSLNARLQRNNAATLTQLGGTQVVDTGVSMSRLLIGKQEATSVLGTSVDVSGNVVVGGRLGIGTGAVNGSGYALDISGNAFLSGRIVQW